VEASARSGAGLRDRLTTVHGNGDEPDPDPGVTVLLVEEEDRLASLVTKGLGARGFEVRRVASGAQAESVDAREIDVVVLDLRLPDIDGLEVLCRLRARGLHVPVVILTARGEIEDRVRGLDLGADDCVAKPFSIDELAARLRARLRPRSNVAARLTVGDLELDLIARRARVGEGVIWLTPREFALLETLMRHAGTTVTRPELLSEVWSLDFDPRSNLVDVYVRYLRRKLGPGWITTERGVGYRMAAPGPEAPGRVDPRRSAQV
jgi:DNA-binding response OmpR family regulator